MSDALLGAAAVALVAGTGLATATTLRLRGLPHLLLGAYVVAFAEVVGLILFLSAFRALTRTAILVGLALLLAASIAAWLFQGAPRPPAIRIERIRAVGKLPVLVVLASATAVALLYVLALIVGTPPNNWDSLTYHLARAALWSQGDGVGYIADPYDERLNFNPPNGEFALTFLLEVGRNERLTGLVQFAAALALAVGVFALARRLCLSRSKAAFGALLFLTLPIVLLQASTTQNDLVAASFLLVATVFLLGDSGRELVLAALATALAIGTKVPAAYGLPVLVGAAVVALPGTYRIRRLAALLAGAAVGSYWYIVNVVRTGHLLGELPEGDVIALLEPAENFFAAYARVLDAFDLSGAVGHDVFVYAFVAAAVAIALILGAQNSPGRTILPALATGALVLAPVWLVPVGYVLWRVFAELHDVLEEPDRRLPVGGWEPQTTASESISWFGPLGLFLVVGVGVAAVLLVRRGSLLPLALVFAAAPLALFILVSTSLAYDEWQGRFLVFPVALSASLWGVILDVRRLAVAAVAIAVTSAALSFVHFIEKPSGLALLERDVPSSAWGMERWEVQSLLRRGMRPVLRFVENEVPTDSVLAVAVGVDDFAYPAFGPGITRRVVLVPKGSSGRGLKGAQWLLVSAERTSEIDRACWRLVHGGMNAWGVFRRAACGP